VAASARRASLPRARSSICGSPLLVSVLLSLSSPSVWVSVTFCECCIVRVDANCVSSNCVSSNCVSSNCVSSPDQTSVCASASGLASLIRQVTNTSIPFCPAYLSIFLLTKQDRLPPPLSPTLHSFSYSTSQLLCVCFPIQGRWWEDTPK